MRAAVNAVSGLGQTVIERISVLGGTAKLALATFLRLFRRPVEFRATVRELEVIGWQSAGVVSMLGLFVGMVLVVQTGFTLKRFGAEGYTSEMVALAILRELGPVLAGFIFDTRGSYLIAFIVATVLCSAGAVCSLLARPPEYPAGGT